MAIHLSQPSWLHKIIKTPLFDTLLKCLKVSKQGLDYQVLRQCVPLENRNNPDFT